MSWRQLFLAATMLDTSTIVALSIAAVIGAAGGLFLLLSGSRGMVFIDKLYGGPWPGRLRPPSERR